jgi:SH3 domain protein
MKLTRYPALFVALFSVAAHANPAWVSDQFEITLRTGPSTQNAIQMMLGSGAKLEVLERDADSGYSRVQTPGGTEGWVLTRYLMPDPSAREQLETLTAQLANVTNQGDSLESQLQSLRGELLRAEQKSGTLEREKARLEQELADLKRTAASAISLNNQNSQLRQTLADAEIQVATLEQENRVLSGQKNRYWFMTGGGVVVVGILLGLWLPRIRMPRRSRYDSF